MADARSIIPWLKSAAREHWLPLLLLIPPVVWVVYQSDAENILPMLPLPLAAFLIGLVLRPRHPWLLWLGSVVFEWIVVIAWGKYDVPGSGETLTSIMLEAFFWMAAGVWLPVWIGRAIRTAYGAGRRSDQSPAP